jgi:hypothetical protein
MTSGTEKKKIHFFLLFFLSFKYKRLQKNSFSIKISICIITVGVFSCLHLSGPPAGQSEWRSEPVYMSSEAGQECG